MLSTFFLFIYFFHLTFPSDSQPRRQAPLGEFSRILPEFVQVPTMLGNAACLCIDGPSGRSGAFTELMSKWLDGEAPLASTLHPVIKVSLCSESHHQRLVGWWADVSASLISLAPDAAWLKGTKVCQPSIRNCRCLTRRKVQGSIPRALFFSLRILHVKKDFAC